MWVKKKTIKVEQLSAEQILRRGIMKNKSTTLLRRHSGALFSLALNTSADPPGLLQVETAASPNGAPPLRDLFSDEAAKAWNHLPASLKV